MYLLFFPASCNIDTAIDIADGQKYSDGALAVKFANIDSRNKM